MTRDEMVDLTEYIGLLCPQQKIAKLTPLAWHDILGHLDFTECRSACAVIAARQPFIAPSEIIAEIAAQRSPEMPHSNACRGNDCRDCRVTWCMCVCHPRAVAKLAGPQSAVADRPAIEGGPRRYEPGQLSIGRPVDDA